MSTISPSATRKFAGKLRSRTSNYLDAPVSGGESGALAATLSIMVGGEAGRVRPLPAGSSTRWARRRHVWARTAAARRRSSSIRWRCSAIWRRLCEALRLAGASGLDVARWPSTRSAAVRALPGSSPTRPEDRRRDTRPGFRSGWRERTYGSCSRPRESSACRFPSTALVEQSFSRARRPRATDEDGTQALFGRSNAAPLTLTPPGAGSHASSGVIILSLGSSPPVSAGRIRSVVTGRDGEPHVGEPIPQGRHGILRFLRAARGQDAGGGAAAPGNAHQPAGRRAGSRRASSR